MIDRAGLLVRNPDGAYAPNPMGQFLFKFTTQTLTLARELALSPTGRAARRTTSDKPPTVSPQANQRGRKTNPVGFA